MRLKHFLSVFLTLLTLSVGQMWGAVGDAITAHGSIADATVYYLAGEATVSSKKSTYYSVLASDAASASVTGNATTTQASGTKYTFLIESSAYYLVTPNGYYVEPHGSSNGKLILTTAKKAVTVSTVSSKIRITGTTNTGKSIQKNKTTNANFGSYGNTQNDLTLYVAGYRVIYDANGATGGTVPTDNTVYGDNASATIKANTGTLVKTGYTFAGWNTAANGSGTDVAATGSASKTITAGLRLYAKWIAAAPSYTITPATNNTNYGTVSLSGSVITGSPKSGYRYASPAYSVSPANSATVSQNGNAFTVTPSANTTVTINFEEIPSHNIIFHTGDLVNIASVSVKEGVEYTVSQTPAASLTSSCEYGTFVGWTTSSSITNASIQPTLITNNKVTMSSSDINLYAVYSKTTGGGSVAAKGTVLWAETWASATTSTGNGTPTKDDAKASNNCSTSKGTTMYGGATISYSETDENVYCRAENTGGGTSPELLLSSGKEWTISGIPTGGATELTLTYASNNTKSSVTCSTTNVTIDGSSKSYTIDNSVAKAETITLVFGCSGNTRIDNVSLTVETAGSSGTTTYSLDPNCCTSLGQINGSFFWSTLFEPLSPDKFRSHILLCNHLFSSSHHRILPHLIYTMYISRDFGFF